MQCSDALCAANSQLHVVKTVAGIVPMSILSLVRTATPTPTVKRQRVIIQAIRNLQAYKVRIRPDACFVASLHGNTTFAWAPQARTLLPVQSRIGDKPR